MPSSFHTSCVATESIPTSEFEGVFKVKRTSHTAILFSGGWDSLYCLIEAQRRIEAPDLLFFDYGQSYLERESIAVQCMQAAGLKGLKYIKYPTIDSKDGIFDNRNGRLIEAAAKMGYDRVYFGSRNLWPLFDRYGDSNHSFAKKMGRELGLDIATPATLKLKSQIIRACEREFPHFSQCVFSTEGLS